MPFARAAAIVSWLSTRCTPTTFRMPRASSHGVIAPAIRRVIPRRRNGGSVNSSTNEDLSRPETDEARDTAEAPTPANACSSAHGAPGGGRGLVREQTDRVTATERPGRHHAGVDAASAGVALLGDP